MFLKIVNILTFISLILLVQRCSSFYLSSRTVSTKFGDLRGLVVKPNHRALGEVEMFLGVPYAAPPLGRFRFMPPTTPDKWSGIRRADSLPPVCPQKLPDVSNRRVSLKKMTVGRYKYLQRLIPQLRNQSENCLYLNIYTPAKDGYTPPNERFPVMVYIHGESYEWNSGNPYDGTVLASYGQVVVVTLNFRLGILGFLRPALNEKYVSNFGLLDQIAALHWIRGNIDAFGGDPDSVTIFGHGTGAALANLLLISPVAQASKRLFQRAILMSGSALATWAFTWDPYKYTIQVAKYLKCPLIDGEDNLVNCLRSKTVDELLRVPLQMPPFTTQSGPIMDGTVLKQDVLKKVLSIDKASLAKYDLLYGVTSAESFNILSASQVKYGMTKEMRNRLIRAYISNTFDHQTSSIYAAVDNEYTTWNSSSGSIPGKRIEMEMRDQVLQILSDAQIIVPVIRMGNLHSSLTGRSYFYVFNHQSIFGDYPFNQGTVHGEELTYVFGAPLVGGFSHFGLNYTLEEQFLSELVMRHWTNFAKTGNPNLPAPQDYKTDGAPFNWMANLRTMWPAYDSSTQQYLHIDMQVVRKSHYRAKKFAFWAKMIPGLISSSNVGGKFPSFGGRPKINFVPKNKIPPPAFQIPPKPLHVPTVPSYPKYDLPHMKSQPGNEFSKEAEKYKEGNKFGFYGTTSATPTHTGTSVNILIIIGVLILLLNLFAIVGFYYKRTRKSRNNSEAEPGDTENERSNGNNMIETPDTNDSSTSIFNFRKGDKLPSKNVAYNESFDNDLICFDGKKKLIDTGSNNSTLRRSGENSNPNSIGSPLIKETKKPSSKVTKSPSVSSKGHKRNKSANSIYSEVGLQDSQNDINRKSPSVKFLNKSSLPPKSMNKSSTSIASMQSTSSKVSVKSNVSKSSVKSNSRNKAIKKNASCQSLPTPEYSWGITSEMLSGNDDFPPEKSLSSNYPKSLPENQLSFHSHSSTLPKTKPAFPSFRCGSLTSSDMDEFEKIQASYKKGANPNDSPVDDLNKRIEPFYGTGAGEAPASPSGMFAPLDHPLSTKKQPSQNSNIDYPRRNVCNQNPPYDIYIQKDPSLNGNMPNNTNVIPTNSRQPYNSSALKTPRGPLGSFSKNKDIAKPYNPSTESNNVVRPAANTISTSPPRPPRESITQSNYPSDGNIPSSKPNSYYPPKLPSQLSTESVSPSQISPFQRDNAGTVKRKKSTKRENTMPELEDDKKERTLKSVLKTTSAYDKPKSSISVSSLSSIGSINLYPNDSTKVPSTVLENNISNSNSLKKGTKSAPSIKGAKSIEKIKKSNK